ncbi:MAG: class F sortase [Chloroflexi bacterium]|nr:class F sortase [Chloroflexota bacterium]MQC16898.1 class F sortase [Chloroflexota bacterium]
MDSFLSRPRVQALIWTGVALIALIVAVVISLNSGYGSGFRFLGLGSSDAAAVALTSDRQIDVALVEGDTPARQDSVAEFAATYGDPPNTDFARMRIPSIGIDAPVGRWIVDASIMPEPYGPVDVAFYDLSDWRGMGGFPGEGGNAVFGAHVDLNRHISYADANYRGPAVFWALDELAHGNVIEVDYAGETLRYAVVWIEEVDANHSDWSLYFTSDVEVDSITLYTCGGEFNRESASYSHRTVIRAERI